MSVIESSPKTEQGVQAEYFTSKVNLRVFNDVYGFLSINQYFSPRFPTAFTPPERAIIEQNYAAPNAKKLSAFLSRGSGELYTTYRRINACGLLFDSKGKILVIQKTDQHGKPVAFDLLAGCPNRPGPVDLLETAYREAWMEEAVPFSNSGLLLPYGYKGSLDNLYSNAQRYEEANKNPPDAYLRFMDMLHNGTLNTSYLNSVSPDTKPESIAYLLGKIPFVTVNDYNSHEPSEIVTTAKGPLIVHNNGADMVFPFMVPDLLDPELHFLDLETVHTPNGLLALQRRHAFITVVDIREASDGKQIHARMLDTGENTYLPMKPLLQGLIRNI